MTLLETLQDPAPRQPVPHHPVRRRPRKPKTQAEQLCRLMQGAIAAAFAVSLRDLRARTRRSQEAAFARQAAMYLAHVVLRQNYRDTGRLFGRDRTTAAYACALVEERRDDPALDALLQTLENVCVDLARDLQAKPEPCA
jgi:chromosomal replication initiation ATPase DnaA